MIGDIDETHRADLRSWVTSANDEATEFPIQNLPLGCVRSGLGAPRPAVAIGDQILDLAAARDIAGFGTEIDSALARCVAEGSLNSLLSMGRVAQRTLRGSLSDLLREDTPLGRRARARADSLLVPSADVTPLIPVRIGDYTDFYASVHHATNVGSMFRPDNPLLPNYKWVPIGYHGRASSVVPSGSVVRRPMGQTREGSDTVPSFGPTNRLDYELEVGAVIGEGSALGTTVPLASAEMHIAGLCLVNDWSARDIQSWEYQPLGPFLAKNFATTVSPWIVTLDALEPFRVPATARAEGDPAPLPYLDDPANRDRGGIDIELGVMLRTARMRAEQLPPDRVSVGSFTSMYWTVGQLVAHHTSNGCNLLPGDLLASGTVSGPTPESRGCLLERTWRGTEPLVLSSGETRRFLEDGDEVLLSGACVRAGFRTIGFGECRGTVSGR